MKRMVSQLEGMVGIGSPIAHDSNWQMSNRQVPRPAGRLGWGSGGSGIYGPGTDGLVSTVGSYV